jgi:two-component system, sensor histidine kinase and response regulator
MCLRKLKILLADDSPNIREMIEVALRAKGYSVEAVADGAQALERVTQANRSDNMYDVVLLDYAMPEMDGLTCALKIREQRPEDKPEVKLGFFTGHDELVLPKDLLQKLHARSWSKLNVLEMVNDLDSWIEAPPCEPPTVCAAAS